MLGSNQRPLPCEVSTIVCWRFLEFAKSLQISILSLRRFSQHFRVFTRVAARLLHTEHARQDSNLRPGPCPHLLPPIFTYLTLRSFPGALRRGGPGVVANRGEFFE